MPIKRLQPNIIFYFIFCFVERHKSYKKIINQKKRNECNIEIIINIIFDHFIKSNENIIIDYHGKFHDEIIKANKERWNS